MPQGVNVNRPAPFVHAWGFPARTQVAVEDLTISSGTVNSGVRSAASARRHGSSARLAP